MERAPTAIQVTLAETRSYGPDARASYYEYVPPQEGPTVGGRTPDVRFGPSQDDSEQSEQRIISPNHRAISIDMVTDPSRILMNLLASLAQQSSLMKMLRTVSWENFASDGHFLDALRAHKGLQSSHSQTAAHASRFLLHILSLAMTDHALAESLAAINYDVYSSDEEFLDALGKCFSPFASSYADSQPNTSSSGARSTEFTSSDLPAEDPRSHEPEPRLHLLPPLQGPSRASQYPDSGLDTDVEMHDDSVIIRQRPLSTPGPAMLPEFHVTTSPYRPPIKAICPPVGESLNMQLDGPQDHTQ